MRKAQLIFTLVLLFVLSAESLGAAQEISDLSYYLEIEAGAEIVGIQLYIKDGVIYSEAANQLWVMGKDFIEKITVRLPEALLEVEELYEIKEIGEEVVSGWQTIHYQAVLRETNTLQREDWLLAGNEFVTVKSISYGEDGTILTKTTLRELDLEPDFSGVDFRSAIPFPLSGKEEQIKLTKAELSKLVPWYNLELEPLPDFVLSGITQKLRSPFDSYLTLLLTYSNGREEISVRIQGSKEQAAETHGPSEFTLLRQVTMGELVLEPAIISERTSILVGFQDPIEQSAGNTFLKNVVLHPTLQ